MIAWLAFAWSMDPAAVLAKVDEIEGMRSLRQAEGVPAISRDAYTTAAEGDVETGLVSVSGQAAKKAWGVGIVDVPIGRYWAAVSDSNSHPTYTKLSSSERLSGTACSGPRSVLQFLPVPFVSDRWWISNLSPNTRIHEESSGGVRELAWTSSTDPADVTTDSGRATIDEGIPIAFTKGAWFLVALDANTTLVEYYVWTDPGGSVPAGMASRFAAGGIEDTITAMARLANDGPSCSTD